MERVVDFENQAFDELGINPYEIVIAVSKMARDINDKARKYLPPEQDVNAISLALRRLEKASTFIYDDERGGTPSPDET